MCGASPCPPRSKCAGSLNRERLSRRLGIASGGPEVFRLRRAGIPVGMTDHDQILLGARFRLVERLGAGGMAVVWRAYDEVLHRRVAVKVVSPALASEERFLRLLRVEARAAAGLSHPNITSV